MPGNREFRFSVDGEFGAGFDLQENTFNNFTINVDTGEKAGKFGVKVEDITFCLVNNDYDRDYCENYATPEELRVQYITLPFMVAKQENMGKALLCTAGDVAGMFPGEVGMIANIAKLLFKCKQ